MITLHANVLDRDTAFDIHETDGQSGMNTHIYECLYRFS